MNRRMMTGWCLALSIAGSGQTARGMQMRDPSASGSVEMTPIDSIGERINTAPTSGGIAPSPGVPTDPTASGPRAKIPKPPVGPDPVGLTTQPSLDGSVAPTPPTGGGFSRLFRRPRTNSTPSRSGRGGLAPKVDPSAIPSRMTWDDSDEPTSMKGASATVPGRPSPYANQAPELPRRQVNAPVVEVSEGSSTAGRPAPLRGDVPRQGRPRLTPEVEAAASKPRPQSQAVVNPRALPPSGPAPPIPSTLPATEATESPATLPPLEMAPIAPSVPAPGSGDPVLDLPALDAAPQPLPEAPEPPQALPPGPTADLGAPPEGMPTETSKVVESPPPSTDRAPAFAPAPPVQVDPELKRTSGEPTALRIDPVADKDRPFASARAAAVGDEVITVHQVETLVVEKYKAMTAGQQVTEEQKREVLNTLGSMAVEHLIEQSLVLQEAKRKMRSGKMKQQFDEFVNKRWREEMLPPLLKKTATTNEYELKRKLAEEGRSYAEMQDNYHKEMLEHDFLYNEIKNKISVDLTQLRAYYNGHIQSYDQPARISWREIEVSVAKYPDRAAARKQADAIRARLRRKEDFAAVAQASSDGPTASKGGLYADMTPGAYGIAPVNDVLNVIPAGEISPVLEAPSSFHIVRVESRRAAGPLPFDEVQKEVASEVFKAQMDKARQQYIDKLRAKTLVRVMPMFERPKGDPNLDGRGDANVLPASNR